MKTVFRYALTRSRGQIIGWGISLALLAVLVVPFYDAFKDQQQQLTDLLNTFPKEIIAFFGDVNDMFSPEGYLSVNFFLYLPLILGVFVILGGSGLLVADEENGTLDLILAHPVSRTALFAGRLAAFVTALLAILVITWVGLVVPIGASSIQVTWSEAALPFFSLFGVLMLFGTMALLLSMILPSRKLAASVAGLVLVASFFITSLAGIIRNLKEVSKLSPISYYQNSAAIQGLNIGWLVGLLAVSAIFIGLAGWLFQKRDIRVVGEGSWRLPLRKKKGAA